MSRDILVATTNQGKILELRAMLDEQARWLSLSDVGIDLDVEEDAPTFEGNAMKKAQVYARASGLWTLSDDSGLGVDALGGRPGVLSARFSGVQSDDRAVVDQSNNEKLLALLENVPDPERTARFMCCICVASPEEVLIESQGAVEGLIARTPSGQGGFGYDPIFYLPRFEKTMAELDAPEKNAISHRGNAIRALKPLLREQLKGG
ncbi:MAG: RdgB/HAM1 family non-canonical purine NTP pyrophosphatase [Phycisphaeraceae bacterium]|nr:RdgB/HAM1 family non-canonical purine NTP pyrophosphatase [Phycisphaeraceae bacterium]